MRKIIYLAAFASLSACATSAGIATPSDCGVQTYEYRTMPRANPDGTISMATVVQYNAPAKDRNCK